MATRLNLLTIIIFLLLVITRAQAQAQEPATAYVLSIDGQNYAIDIGIPATVKFGKEEHRILLKKAPYRKFDFYGISFNFPSDFIYSHQQTNQDVETWKIIYDLSNLTIHKFRFDIDEKELVKLLLPELKKQFNGMPIKEESTTFKTKKGKFNGVLLNVSMNEITVVLELYPIKTKSGIFAFIFNEPRDDPKEPNEDSKIFFKVLAETLMIEK